MSEQTAFPLSWPEGWPRTVAHARRQSPFLRPLSYGSRMVSMEQARTFLARELRLLGAVREVLSTNVRLRLDGIPYSGQAQPSDPGAAVYFHLKGPSGRAPVPTSLACDKWNRVEDNVYAIAKHIEAVRGQQRWGVGSIEQAFRGYQALPAVGESEASTWWRILGVPVNASPDHVREAYRILVKKHHPDLGGEREFFERVQRAMERYEAQVKEAQAA